ncbi:hypothetical protein BDV98DRAFT_608520 [Pterulicium gracile]|uniref:AA9 family lytic polysaccharide monooxygenase n=1 Tax=Pterulicium gracile TaxID=1884261 RepID=A0A5C3Q6Z1_9AGAR|nr:hypothetical protein BDV98DRAFT_608520 [Pterula gracilis]
MSQFNSYAVLGAGRVGGAFISALLAAKPTASIVILTRSESVNEKKSSLPAEIANSAQVKIVPVDYTSGPMITAALKENAVEVVVDTVPEYAAQVHNALGDAAKEAGTVRLFVPSEFASVTEDGTEQPQCEKSATHKHLKEIGLSYAVIPPGLFIESCLGSCTPSQDVAGFLAHILVTYPSSKLEFTAYRIEGVRLTLKEAAAKFKLPIEFVDAVPAPPSDFGYEPEGDNFQTQLQKQVDCGMGSIGWDFTRDKDDESLAGSGNKFWAIIALHGAFSYPGVPIYPSCIQVQVTGSGNALPTSFVSFPGAYAPSTPGIVYDIYSTAPSHPYSIPGPAVWTGGN